MFLKSKLLKWVFPQYSHGLSRSDDEESKAGWLAHLFAKSVYTEMPVTRAPASVPTPPQRCRRRIYPGGGVFTGIRQDLLGLDHADTANDVATEIKKTFFLLFPFS